MEKMLLQGRYISAPYTAAAAGLTGCSIGWLNMEIIFFIRCREEEAAKASFFFLLPVIEYTHAAEEKGKEI